jgi:hypothetical protein
MNPLESPPNPPSGKGSGSPPAQPPAAADSALDGAVSTRFLLRRRPLTATDRKSLEKIFKKTRPGRPGIFVGIGGSIVGGIPFALSFGAGSVPGLFSAQGAYFGIPELYYIVAGLVLSAVAGAYTLLDRGWRRDFRAMVKRGEVWEVRGPSQVHRTTSSGVQVTVGRLQLKSVRLGRVSERAAQRAAARLNPETPLGTTQLTYVPPLWFDPGGALGKSVHPHLDNGILLKALPQELLEVSPFWSLRTIPRTIR